MLKVIEGIDRFAISLIVAGLMKKNAPQVFGCLESYKRGWDDKSGCWRDNPVHNEASHGADAFRILAISLSEAKPGMTKDDLDRLKMNAGLYAGRKFLQQTALFL